MTDPAIWAMAATALLIGLIILTHAALKGWHGWLDLQRLRIVGHREPSIVPSSGTRIELADLRERIRKLEAIAAGVDL